jgi:hypothetical protein
MVVRCGPPSKTLNESLESRFSLVVIRSEDVHATENGCEVHNPSDGI